MEPWHFYLMSLLYLLAGITHFIKSNWYIPVIPPGIPHKLMVVHLSGLLEIYLAVLLLFPYWKPVSLLGIILMLAFFLPIHIYMIYEKRFRRHFPLWLLWLRVPLQFLLMFWAYSYY